ncbi:hypothetical protein IFM89_020403 [Coptis chinensis]|uniref:DUF7953 domain-containing protein n=1 Tax=Coptis chinensis TaxID=261450 RepID=A0A835HIT0_9MAGN|nr:hypothetical protein IFM89_020403 [Coptis chinensis]
MTQSPSSNSKTRALLYIFLCLIPGILCTGVVTLEKIEIYKTHEWLKAKPTVYFQCQGENMTILPDVKEINLTYTFKGEESWQPLTELEDKKCKRCGFYEKDTLTSDDVFDEWEFCPSILCLLKGDISVSKETELNATFTVLSAKSSTLYACSSHLKFSYNFVTVIFLKETGSAHASSIGPKEKKTNVALVIIISSLLSCVCIIGAVVAYKYWKKRKREQEQARFLKLFEDGDSIEDEFSLEDVL